VRKWTEGDNKMPDGKEKILFITSNRIGDAMLSTGLLDHLVHKYRESEVTVACGPGAVPLFEAANNVTTVIPMVKKKASGHWLKLWRDVVDTRWDVVVDLRASAIAWLLLAEKRYVLNTGKSSEAVHRVIQLANLMELDPPPNPRVWLTKETRAKGAELVPKGGMVLGLGPTANWTGKQWPAENFAEAANRLTSSGGILEGARIAVFGGPGEEQMAAPVLRALPADRVVDLVGKVDVGTAAAALIQCSYFIGNDSGLMHIASSVGVPTLGLFGPSREEHYAPWGMFAQALRTPDSYDEIVGQDGYDFSASAPSYMQSLTVEAVVEAADAHFKGLFGG
jgi:heptosyltransferase III